MEVSISPSRVSKFDPETFKFRRPDLWRVLGIEEGITRSEHAGNSDRTFVVIAYMNLANGAWDADVLLAGSTYHDEADRACTQLFSSLQKLEADLLEHYQHHVSLSDVQALVA